MTTMVERVARALRRQWSIDNFDRPSDVGWEDEINAARAAIEEMREPTDEMVRAGNASKPWNVTGYCEGTVHPVCQRSWSAMIDDALR